MITTHAHLHIQIVRKHAPIVPNTHLDAAGGSAASSLSAFTASAAGALGAGFAMCLLFFCFLTPSLSPLSLSEPPVNVDMSPGLGCHAYCLNVVVGCQECDHNARQNRLQACGSLDAAQ